MHLEQSRPLDCNELYCYGMEWNIMYCHVLYGTDAHLEQPRPLDAVVVVEQRRAERGDAGGRRRRERAAERPRRRDRVDVEVRLDLGFAAMMVWRRASGVAQEWADGVTTRKT